MSLKLKLLYGVVLGVICTLTGLVVGYYLENNQSSNFIMMAGYVVTVISAVLFFFVINIHYGLKIFAAGIATGFLGHVIHLTLGVYPSVSEALYFIGEMIILAGFIVFGASVLKRIKDQNHSS